MHDAPMDFRNVIGLPRGVFQVLGNGERSSFGRDVKESRQGGGNASVAAWPRLLGRESGQISTGPTHIDMGAHLFYIARLPMGATANRSISSSLKIPLGLLLTVPLAVCLRDYRRTLSFPHVDCLSVDSRNKTCEEGPQRFHFATS